MSKSIFCLGFILTNLGVYSQNYISFRNCLNEANYWFYEGEFDSSMVYYSKAEKFNLPFYPEEVHLFSRNLWELGDKVKSIHIVEKYGLKDFFLKDTTYYKGLSFNERVKIASRIKKVELDLLCDDIAFYDSLRPKDDMYRKILPKYSEGSQDYDSIVKLMTIQDSLNFYSLIHQIKLCGYPGGYRIAPVGPGVVLLHAGAKQLFNSYSIFLDEIEAGRMSYFDFSRAIDRFFVSNAQQRPYNSYLPLEEAEVGSPLLVFVNRCSIGMSPYYDVYIPKLYPRGKTPPKSKLYAYYKRAKQNFNCIKIK